MIDANKNVVASPNQSKRNEKNEATEMATSIGKQNHPIARFPFSDSSAALARCSARKAVSCLIVLSIPSGVISWLQFGQLRLFIVTRLRNSSLVLQSGQMNTYLDMSYSSMVGRLGVVASDSTSFSASINAAGPPSFSKRTRLSTTA